MPGCVLRAGGPTFSPADFVDAFPVANIAVRGGTLIVSVSQRDGHDFSGQVLDAIAYLHTHESAIRQLLGQPGVQAYLDFGVYYKAAFCQSSAFAPELVAAAGILGLGLEISMYASP